MGLKKGCDISSILPSSCHMIMTMEHGEESVVVQGGETVVETISAGSTFLVAKQPDSRLILFHSTAI